MERGQRPAGLGALECSLTRALRSSHILRVALVGQGFMGRVHSNAYRLAPHFFELPYRLECKVICGRDRSRLQQMANTWGWEETATSWESVVERKGIDVVDIAAPNSLHAPIAIEAARAGMIVFCEKPLANSTEEASRIRCGRGPAVACPRHGALAERADFRSAADAGHLRGRTSPR